VRRPRLFLLDEPLASLDAHLRAGLREQIVGLQRSLGAIMLVVTHDQVEALTMADRIVVMKDGRPRQVGTPREVYDRPRDRFVAGFVGSPAMSFLEGVVSPEAGAPAFRHADFVLPLGRAEEGLAPGRPVVLGFRPEHALPEPAGAGIPGPRGSVERIESHGAQSFLRLRAGSAELLARVDPRAAWRPGDAVALRLTRWQLFDGEGGATLGSGPERED
jgi:ABC-type sugar transport system ATPase subunit